MNCLTLEQRFQIVERYFKNRSFVRETYRALCPFFYHKILFTEQAHFWLNGYVNKQNCHIWSETNPRQYLETALNPLKWTVRCGVQANGIIGPYFFRNEEGAAVTVNGVRYRHILNTFFFPKMQELNIDISWFQQDCNRMVLRST